MLQKPEISDGLMGHLARMQTLRYMYSVKKGFLKDLFKQRLCYHEVPLVHDADLFEIQLREGLYCVTEGSIIRFVVKLISHQRI